MTRFKQIVLTVLLIMGALCGALTALAAESGENADRKIVQAQVVLTVSESKRLIAKAVAQIPIVKKALEDGMVIITKGTTNTYVAEEILGEKIEHGALVSGRIYPAKGGKRLKPGKRMREIVIVKGEVRKDLSLGDAVTKLKPGDVVIKGANALDYKNKTTGVLIGAPNSGTCGKIVPYVVARKAHLIIPVGLEKQIAGNVIDVADKMREPVEPIGNIPSMFLLTGHIMTEIEALKSFADVLVFQAAAGGIGGAEGSVWLVFRGLKEEVDKALKAAGSVQGEAPFVK